MASSSDARADAPNTVRGAFTAGRAVWLGMWALTVGLSLPMSLAVRDTIAAHLDDSVVADRLARGVDWDWWQEFQQQASGLGTTFVPSILGGAAPVRNLSDVVDAVPVPLSLVAVLVLWFLIWSFVSGGVFDRMARDRRVGGQAFFGATRCVWRAWACSPGAPTGCCSPTFTRGSSRWGTTR
jgi:hypothetical protein